jgi:RNA polymerase sigma-70 factor (ECF subfamily)
MSRLLAFATKAVGPRLAWSRAAHRESLREVDDRALLLALRDADEEALDELIDRKTAPLIKLIQRMVGDLEEARDIVQITFVRLWEHRQRFDERWAANTWIYRIATNLAIDFIRSRNSRHKTAEPLRFHVLHQEDGRSRQVTARQHEDEVMAIFEELAADLSPQQRMVFLLRELEDLPSKEVAEIVGIRESTVRNHLFNARKELRQKLLARYPEYARGREIFADREEGQ